MTLIDKLYDCRKKVETNIKVVKALQLIKKDVLQSENVVMTVSIKADEYNSSFSLTKEDTLRFLDWYKKEKDSDMRFLKDDLADSFDYLYQDAISQASEL